jgi:hypothetical protein
MIPFTQAQREALAEYVEIKSETHSELFKIVRSRKAGMLLATLDRMELDVPCPMTGGYAADCICR